MRKSNLYLFAIVLVTAGYVVAAPVTAGPLVFTVQSGAELPPPQKSEYDSWPAEQQAEYELWPAETQGYYWELAPERKALFWRLSDEDKIAITAMTGTEREAAWTRIEGKASAPSK